MIEEPRVSIGIPIYGVEKYIERCAQSVFEQTYENIEYIFVDDCTPDKSIDILKNVVNQYPTRKPHIKIIHHKVNKGLAAARNTAVEKATGDFLLWVDSDDYINKDLVERCVKKQQESDCDIVLFDFLILQKYGNVINRHNRCSSVKDRTLKLLARQTAVCVWGGFYRLSLYKNHDVKAVEGVNNNEDYQVSPRLSYYSHSIAYLDQPLYYYDRTNETSITQNFNINQAEQGWKSISILSEFFRDKGEEYMNAIQIAKIGRVAMYLKASIYAGNKAYYSTMRKKQSEVGMQWAYSVPPLYRIYLYLNNYFFLRIYTKTAVHLNYVYWHAKSCLSQFRHKKEI